MHPECNLLPCPIEDIYNYRYEDASRAVSARLEMWEMLEGTARRNMDAQAFERL